MRTRSLSAPRALFAVGMLIGVPAAAQEGGPPPPPTELVFERELFSYPTYERRDPFQPLVGNMAGGPRYEQVRLRGIIWSPDPARSLALFGIGTPTGGAPAPERGETVNTRRLRVGESWGNVRVVEIHRDRVVLDVMEFGLTERRVLELTRQRGGGGT